MIYSYKCSSCEHNFDVVKSVSAIDNIEACLKCNSTETARLFSPKIYISGAKVTHAEYNPGLGCVVQNKHHKNDILKERGLIEIGNETPDTIYKETVVKREKQREKEWSEL